MTSPGTTIAAAFPLHSADRQRLRDLFGHPLPAIYPDSVAQPCKGCGMTLAVGPRTTAAMQADPSIVVVCPECLATKVPLDEIADRIQSLGNPDSKFEGE